MYSSEQINTLHQSLQKLFPLTPVILGGSYLYNEAGEDSDVDFYVLCTWRQFFSFFRQKKYLKKQKESMSNLNFSVMFVPKMFFTHGWYFVYGQDINGKMYASKKNNSVIFRQSLKLSYFYYINFVVSDRKPVYLLKKSVKQIFVALSVLYGSNHHPIFSSAKLGVALKNNPFYQSLKKVFELTEESTNRVSEIDGAEKKLLAALQFVSQNSNHFLQFSPLNYLIYNIWFLLRKQTLFLSKNPDKFIIKQMQTTVQDKKIDMSVFKQLKERILLVFII